MANTRLATPTLQGSRIAVIRKKEPLLLTVRRAIVADCFFGTPARFEERAVPQRVSAGKESCNTLNYWVPPSSVVARVHRGVVISSGDASTVVENLGDWTTSQGRALPRAKIIVEA